MRSNVDRAGIPIENIYYLLCYSWDALDVAERVHVNAEEAHDISNLFARVLVGATEELISNGIGVNYREREESIAGVRGKLNISGTFKTLEFALGRTVCNFDDLTMDSPENRIIKAALKKVIGMPRVDATIKRRARRQLDSFSAVADEALSQLSFRNVRVRAPRSELYKLLLNVCALIQYNPFISEAPGRAGFVNFKGDQAQMARLFEQFVYNFYAREQTQYSVRRPVIAWHGAKGSDEDMALLPIMRTDVVLSSASHRMVIDTKYYRKAFQSYQGVRKVRSTHLYQLVSYIQNMSAASQSNIEGILLYPSVDENFEMSYELLGHQVKVKSLDLARPWQSIREDLLQICA